MTHTNGIDVGFREKRRKKLDALVASVFNCYCILFPYAFPVVMVSCVRSEIARKISEFSVNALRYNAFGSCATTPT